MNTQYEVGDILVIITYTDEKFVSNVKSIEITDKDISYNLAQLHDNGKPVKVYEKYRSDCLYNIVKKIGNINDLT